MINPKPYKVIEFKAKRTLHDSGYRHIAVKGVKYDEEKKTEVKTNLGEYHDVIHLSIGGIMGSWINIDCAKDGTYRIFTFASPEGPKLEVDILDANLSSLFVNIKDVRVGNDSWEQKLKKSFND